MRIYFLSSIPCSLYIGGVYFGATSHFERFASVELSDHLPVRFEGENHLPITFFLTEALRKLHTLVQKGQDELMERINQTIDEKIAMFEGEGGEGKSQKPTKKVKA